MTGRGVLVAASKARLWSTSGCDWFGEESVVQESRLELRHSDRQGHEQPSVCPWPSDW